MFYVLVAIAAVGALCLLRSCWELKHFVCRSCEITTRKIRGDLDGFRFVMLADLHNNSFGKNNEKLLEAIRQAKPDAVLIAGDMIVAKGVHSMEVPLHLLRELSREYPIYYANGNHEDRMDQEREIYQDQYDRYRRALKEMGVHYLVNESAVIEKPGSGRIRITGLDLPERYYRHAGKNPMDKNFLEDTLGKADPEEFHVLLAHTPLYFEEYAKWGADLVCSGHFHGGTVKLPFLGGMITPNYIFFPKYDSGIYRENQSVMALTAGLGTHSVNVRFLNRPELYIITLHQDDSKKEG